MEIYLFAAAFTVIVLSEIYRRYRKNNLHKWRIRKASRVISKLKSIELPALQFGFLRSSYVDPYTFEETILTALSNAGLKIKRNKRYSNDGGVDGKAWVNGRLVLIQAKRYRNHINPSHVREFICLCRKYNALGLFVHTGKTGPASRELTSTGIDIVSGRRVLDLLCGNPVSIFSGHEKFLLYKLEPVL